MSTEAPNRIVELWPRLTNEDRQLLIDVAETKSADHSSFDLTAQELELLDQSRRDFAEGRTLSMDEFSSQLDAVMKRLAHKSDATGT